MQESHKRVQWVYESTNDTELEQRYDQWAADYDNDLAAEFEWNAPQNATDVFIKHVDRTAHILDAGAGTGLVGWISSQIAADVIALVDEKMQYKVSLSTGASKRWPLDAEWSLPLRSLSLRTLSLRTKVALPKLRIPAIFPLRATAICTDGSNPSANSRSARSNNSSSLRESIPTISGDSAKNLS